MENDASVEIRKKRGFPPPLGKVPCQKQAADFSTFPTGPTAFSLFEYFLKDCPVNGTGDRTPGFEKENPRRGYVGMGNHNPRT